MDVLWNWMGKSAALIGRSPLRNTAAFVKAFNIWRVVIDRNTSLTLEGITEVDVTLLLDEAHVLLCFWPWYSRELGVDWPAACLFADGTSLCPVLKWISCCGEPYFVGSAPACVCVCVWISHRPLVGTSDRVAALDACFPDATMTPTPVCCFS